MSPRLGQPLRVIVAVGLAAALSLFAVRWFAAPPTVTSDGTPPSADGGTPSLNCAFHSYTNSELVAGFDFSVSFLPSGLPRLEERRRGVLGSEQIVFDEGQRPIWDFTYDEGTPTIQSPDGATRIVLYGLKLGEPGTFFIEAGVRSNEFRNLGGLCRQVDFTSKLAPPAATSR